MAYYENIWPFKDECCSLFFDVGKYLIKAPIGSGKSFLFFDAPKYALYKHSDRNMLNLKSKSAEISMIFDVDGVYYLIKRFLKSTKAWNDSCSSQLFMINYDGENLLKDIKSLTWNTEILQWWENAIEKFESKNKKLWEIDEISLKNETDVQNKMNEILPSKDVFLNTVFLLQDAKNIFEAWEKERIDILKRVFDLLWFDGAVDIVKERKAEVESRLKALKDTSLLDDKLRMNMNWLYDKVSELKNDEELNSILSQNDEFFDPIEQNFDKLLINNFTLNWFDKNCYDKAEILIQKRMEVVIKLDAQLSEFQQQLSSVNQQKLKVWDDIQSAKLSILDLQKKIDNIDTKKWNELKQKKIELFQKKELLDKNANYSDFSGLIEFWNNGADGIIDDFESFNLPEDLKSAYDILQNVINAWKSLKKSIDSVNTELKYLDSQEKARKMNHDHEVEKMKELKSRKEDEIKQQKNIIEELDKMWAENSDFDCPDLCKKCPHIKAINKQQYEQYSQKKNQYEETLSTLKAEYDKQDFVSKIKELENQKNPEVANQKKDLEKKLNDQTDFSNKLKEYLLAIKFAEWEKSYRDIELIQNEIQDIDKQLFQWEEESKNLEKYQQDKVAAETSIQHLEKSLLDFDKQVENLNEKILWVKQEKENSNSIQIQQQQNGLKQIFQYISNLETLIQDNLNNANLSKKLTEEKEKLKDLIKLLSSDVILFALWQYLPALSDIINNYLSQCVDYSIKMDAVEKDVKGWTDIELEVKVLDEKWERDVKSLSGWQRTILNLVRMLAISSYLRTPLLFLDETINNLDVDTVWKVSEMINNFVKQRTMKFYTVTHNKEIQDMQIWDDVIEINWIEKTE